LSRRERKRREREKETRAGFWVGLKERKGREKDFAFSFEIDPNKFNSNCGMNAKQTKQPHLI
jgi:hypothetical protein